MTKKLVYTPGVSAYVAITGHGAVETYDLTDDILEFSIDLTVDDSSRFSMNLKNEGGKYTGKFNPMDRIIIYLTKIETYPVLVGYISKAPYFRLNNSEITIEGKDALYRLQRLYWDKKLEDSYWLTYRQQDDTTMDGGFWKSGVSVLTEVANWSPEKIHIGDISREVIDWVSELYQARLEDTQGTELVEQVYGMIRSTGSSIVSTGSASGVAGVGAEIVIPEPYGTTYTYMGWQMITARSSTQWKFKDETGMPFDMNGFGFVNGRYVIACAPMFGKVGDYIDWVLTNGSVINSVVGDLKGADKDSVWGHDGGRSVIEFVVDKSSWYNTSRHPLKFHPEWDARAAKSINVGNYWGT